MGGGEARENIAEIERSGWTLTSMQEVTTGALVQALERPPRECARFHPLGNMANSDMVVDP